MKTKKTYFPLVPTYPVINLNGTDGEELVTQWRNVLQQCRALNSAMQEAAPHGRDYQTMPHGAYALACDTHDYHLRTLRALSDHAENVIMALRDQQNR